MTDSLTPQPYPIPPLPKHITEHLRYFTNLGKRVRRRLKFLITFAQRENGTSRLDDKTFALLQLNLKASNPRFWREAVLSAWVLGRADLTEEQSEKAVKDLSAVLDDKGKLKTARRGIPVIWAVVNASLWGVASALLLFFVDHYITAGLCPGEDSCGSSLSLYALPAAIPLVLTPIVFIYVIVWQANHILKIKEQAVSALGSLGKPEGVPALLRSAQLTSFHWSLLKVALEQTLPSLTFEKHYRALGKEVVPDLCNLVRHSTHVMMPNMKSYQSLLLTALAEIGDSRAIQPLQEFERSLTRSKPSSPEVMTQTERVLETLRERDAKETAQLTLLRGSTAPVSPETLLRSYEGTPETEPEQLLRSSQKDDE